MTDITCPLQLFDDVGVGVAGTFGDSNNCGDTETEESEYTLTDITRPLQLFDDLGVGVAGTFGD